MKPSYPGRKVCRELAVLCPEPQARPPKGKWCLAPEVRLGVELGPWVCLPSSPPPKQSLLGFSDRKSQWCHFQLERETDVPRSVSLSRINDTLLPPQAFSTMANNRLFHSVWGSSWSTWCKKAALAADWDSCIWQPSSKKHYYHFGPNHTAGWCQCRL